VRKLVRERIEYYCGVCGRRYPNKEQAFACEQKTPYPADFEIGDECVIILSDGHKDNAYLCKVTGMDLVEHHYVRLLKVIKQISNPYKNEYVLNPDDERLYGAH